MSVIWIQKENVAVKWHLWYTLVWSGESLSEVNKTARRMIKETTKRTDKHTCYSLTPLTVAYKHTCYSLTPLTVAHKHRCEEGKKENKLRYGKDRYLEYVHNKYETKMTL
jgi:hypothetical protein